MARGKRNIKKRQIEGDKIYNSFLVAKFINNLMKSGQKTAAQKVFYNAMDLLSKDNPNPLSVFETAIQNVGPKQEVKSKRVGGANYQVPMDVRPERRMSLAIRWIIEAARSRSNKEYHRFEEKLAAEFLEASQNLGAAIKKRDTVQRMADANRAFSHFRF